MGLRSCSWPSALDYPCWSHQATSSAWFTAPQGIGFWGPPHIPLRLSLLIARLHWYGELLRISHLTRFSSMALNPKASNFSSPWLLAIQSVWFWLQQEQGIWHKRQEEGRNIYKRDTWELDVTRTDVFRYGPRAHYVPRSLLNSLISDPASLLRHLGSARNETWSLSMPGKLSVTEQHPLLPTFYIFKKQPIWQRYAAFLFFAWHLPSEHKLALVIAICALAFIYQ